MKGAFAKDVLLKVRISQVRTRFLLKHLKKRSKKWQRIHTSIHLGAVIEMAREEKNAREAMQQTWEKHSSFSEDKNQEVSFAFQ
jgi:hypothetical protein